MSERGMKGFLKRAIPLDPQEFVFAFELFRAAGSSKMPTKNPTQCVVNLDTGDGRVDKIAFADIPLNRGTLAVSQHFAGDSAKYYSFMLRFFALSELLADESDIAKQWIRPMKNDGKDGKDIHSAVMDLSATAPLNSKGCFNHKAFFTTLKQLAATEKYADHTWAH
jgi:hypothetical protein